MKIAITGASGNVGTALLRRLRDSGHDLTGISRRRPAAGAEPYDSAEWKTIDLSTTTAQGDLTETFRGMDAVVHLAWMIQPSHDRALMRATNQGGTRAVAAAVQAAGVAHLVHMSSVGTYAAAPGQWKDEEWSTAGVPTSSYSVDKSAAEAIVTKLDSSVTVTRVRPGPDPAARRGQRNRTLFPRPARGRPDCCGQRLSVTPRSPDRSPFSSSTPMTSPTPWPESSPTGSAAPLTSRPNR